MIQRFEVAIGALFAAFAVLSKFVLPESYGMHDVFHFYPGTSTK